MSNSTELQFGDAAYVIQLVTMLLLDAIALTQPSTARVLINELDKLLGEPLPTLGISRGVLAVRQQIEMLHSQAAAPH